MSQVSYGTITITDMNDIEEIYTIYAGSNTEASPTFTYAAVTGGTIWKRDASALSGFKYIWQSTVVTKSGVTIDSTNWQQFYSQPVRLTGLEGDDARNITAVTPYYYLSTSDSSQTGGSWSTTPQPYPSMGTAYYWTKTVTTYDSGSPSESTAVLDMFLTNAAKDARDANTNAALANSIATHANEDAQGAMAQSANGIKEIYRIWLRTNSATLSQSLWPTTHVTSTADDVNNTWTTVKPKENSDNRYYFYCEETVTNGGVSSWTNPVLDTSNLSQYEIDVLTTKVKNFWWNSDGAHIASGINGANVDKNSPVSAYGFNSLVGLSGISFGYNDAKVIDLNTTPSPTSLKFYQPPIISGSTVSQGALSMELSSNALKFYGSSTSTADATLNSTGLKLVKGGIESGNLTSGNGYVYLSTEDKAGIEINGHTPSSSGPKWRAVIGSKFGVDSEGNLYANSATITGAITATSLTINNYDYIHDIPTISDKADSADSNWTVLITTTGTPDYVTPSVTLKATVYHEGVVVTSGFTRAWYKNGTGTSLGNGETITVTDIDAFYTCVIS